MKAILGLLLRAVALAKSRMRAPAVLQANPPDRPPLDFVHIPKTAGTSIEAAGVSFHYEWGGAKTGWPGGDCARGCKGTWQPCSPQHIPPAVYKARGEGAYNGTSTFCVVRHPYTRAMSEFAFANYIMGTAGGHKNYPDRVGLPTWRLAESCTAASLNEWVLGTLGQIESDLLALDGRSVPSPRAAWGDCHWLPQWMYVDDGPVRNASCDHILHYENLDDEFRALMDSWDYVYLAQVNLSQRTWVNLATDCALDLYALNATTRALIRRTYGRDFAQFGYSATPVPQALGGQLKARFAERQSAANTAAAARAAASRGGGGG